MGLRYVCDWVNDEQPYPLKVPQGELYALPIALPVDDVNALWDRRIDIDRYRDMITETFDTLYAEGSQQRPAAGAAPASLAHRPAVSHWPPGQALGHIMQHQGVWAATGAEIIDWYRAHPPVAR